MNLPTLIRVFIISILTLVSVPHLAFCTPNEQAITASFQELVKKHVEGYKEDPRVMVYYVSGHEPKNVKDGWRKSKCVVADDYSYAVQKTDSTIKPYTAYLIYKMAILVSPAQPTKELAENTQTFKENPSQCVIRITFSYQDGKWSPKKYEEQVRIQPTLPPIWLNITQDPSQVHFRRMIVRDIENV